MTTDRSEATQVVHDLYFLAYCIANNLPFRPDAGALLRAAGGKDAVLQALSANILPNVDNAGKTTP